VLAVPLDRYATLIRVQIEVEATVHPVELDQVFGRYGEGKSRGINVAAGACWDAL